MGVSDAPWGVVDANHLLLLGDGVGLLTAGGGPSCGVGCRGAGDVVGARRLTLSGGLLSLGRGSLGGCGSWGGFFRAWAWRSLVSHAVENLPFYASLWSSTISGKNIARLSNVRFL